MSGLQLSFEYLVFIPGDVTFLVFKVTVLHNHTVCA